MHVGVGYRSARLVKQKCAADLQNKADVKAKNRKDAIAKVD